MLYDKKQLPELLYMKHRHDDDKSYIKYDERILDSMTSPYLYNNNMMNSFLKRLQPLISIIFDHMNVMNNFKNYIVDKYHYKNVG
jgi:hypothetical protein